MGRPPEADVEANYVRARLDEAEGLLAKDDYRRAVKQLDRAFWRLSNTSPKEDFCRLEQLSGEAAAGASGRQAERALRLQDGARAEINRRLAGETSSPQHVVPQQDTAMPVGMWVMIGAVLGLATGAVAGAVVASGGGDIQELNDLAGLLVAVVFLLFGASVGLGVGLTNQRAARNKRLTGTRPPAANAAELPHDPRLPFPPHAETSPPLEHDSEPTPPPQ